MKLLPMRRSPSRSSLHWKNDPLKMILVRIIDTLLQKKSLGLCHHYPPLAKRNFFRQKIFPLSRCFAFPQNLPPQPNRGDTDAPSSMSTPGKFAPRSKPTPSHAAGSIHSKTTANPPPHATPHYAHQLPQSKTPPPAVPPSPSR